MFAELLDPALGWFLFLVLGVLVGVLSAILGIGGGLLMVPALAWWGASPVQAVATSLLAIVLGAISGTFQNWRTKSLNLERVTLMAPPAMLTTELGVWLANWLPATVLLVSFAVLQVVAIFLIEVKGKLADATTVAFENTPTGARLYESQAIGLLAGILSGLFGVGGGVVMVPLQVLFLDEKIKDAVRTSLGAVALIAIWAVGRHALSGNVLWLPGLCLGVGSLAGAQVGARVLPALSDSLVRLAFRGLLLILAASMVLRALISGG